MTNWRYFIHTNEPNTIETGVGALLRLEQGDPWGMAEVLHPDGQWATSDTLVRYYLLGSNDTDLTEITPQRADNIVHAWYGRARISSLPVPLPSSTSDITRTPEDQLSREQGRAQARAFQDQAEKIYSAVPVPPGAEDIPVSNK